MSQCNCHSNPSRSPSQDPPPPQALAPNAPGRTSLPRPGLVWTPTYPPWSLSVQGDVYPSMAAVDGAAGLTVKGDTEDTQFYLNVGKTQLF